MNPTERISVGPWGSSGESNFNFAVDPTYIKQIVLSHRENIKSISFKDADGWEYGPFGGQSPNQNGVRAVIDIGDSQRLSSISGTYGIFDKVMVITSLSFLINNVTIGPFGTKTGTSFSNPIHGGEVVGFFGKSGWYLDSIGLYVKPMTPRESFSVGPWGSPDGSNFTFAVDPSYIKQIVLSHRENIKSISFKDADGREYGPFGGQSPNQNGVRAVIDIGDSQRLTSISGTYGIFDKVMVITSLSFLINNTTIGPYGTKTGTSFSNPVQGNEVIGFFGKSGWYLDSIGLHVKRMNPRPRESFSVGPWGNSGGINFTFAVDPSYIKQIVLSHRENIKSISFKDADGREYGPFGGQSPNQNGVRAVIDIGDSGRLTSISGTYGFFDGVMVITSLSFLKNNNTTIGPYGTKTGTPFFNPIPEGEVIGFFGKSGWYLDSIGLYVKPMALSNASVAQEL